MEPAMGIMSIPAEYFKKVGGFNLYFHNCFYNLKFLCFPFKFHLIFVFYFHIYCRHVSYVNKCVVPAPNATNALHITTQCVHQELVIAWRLNASHF